MWKNGAYLTLKLTSVLDTENLRRVPSVAADTFQPVQVILVEDLRREHKTKKVSHFGKVLQFVEAKLVLRLRVVTHIAELLVDFACLDVHLHVREANPLMQILAVVDPADGGLGVAGRQNLQHVWWDVVLGLGLLVTLFVQTLQRWATNFSPFIRSHIMNAHEVSPLGELNLLCRSFYSSKYIKTCER